MSRTLAARCQLDPAWGYALCMDSAADGTLAVATSERTIVFYDLSSQKLVNSQGQHSHASRINELRFSSSHTLHSASSDGCVKIWDPSIPSKSPSITLSSDDGTEVWSVDVKAQMLAAGTESGIVIWDVRHTATPLTRYEVHTEAVTQVRFCATDERPLLISGSMDGLICEMDCSQKDEDEAVVGIHNAEDPITGLGLFDTNSGTMTWTISSTDQLSLWDLPKSERLCLFDKLVPHSDATCLEEGHKPGTSDEPSKVASCTRTPVTLDQTLDYVVCCYWDPANEQLMMVGGQSSGIGYVYEVSAAGVEVLTRLSHCGTGSTGHTDRIRCCSYSSLPGLLATGAEDGCVCIWAVDRDGELGPAATQQKGSTERRAKRAKGKDNLRAKPY